MNQTKKQQLVKKLANKEYRHAWASESIKMALPFQIQANREKRDWSQSVLGVKSDMKQNAISRLESMDYGNLTVNTLLRLAYGFDVGLLIKFVPFSRLVQEFEDVSTRALLVNEFEKDTFTLSHWANSTDATPIDDFQLEETISSKPISDNETPQPPHVPLSFYTNVSEDDFWKEVIVIPNADIIEEGQSFFASLKPSESVATW